ncbi:MAG: diguanylate cyclase [Acidobacteria bacterium]|nr:diguanylate cyclase [Acidobacteriota bacterium]
MADHYRILVVDDREENLDMLREWLSSQDYYVRCARDGREALQMAREDPPDLILLDKVMPEVDGLSVARELKKEGRFSGIPIVVLAGRDDASRRTIVDTTPADDLITKPLTFEEVDLRVRTMLKKREVFRALERANEELRQANEKMSRLLRFDERTDLFNYRHFMERLDEEFKRARRHGNYLTLIMLDIDLFKHVNDRYGHPAGDQVLKEFGAITTRQARETDILARYGGEEFAILLPQTAAVHGQRLADRIRRITEAHVFQAAEANDSIRITISAGVATSPTNERIASLEDLVKAADDALYRAKQDGRNRTHVDERSIAGPP